jgi:hypothetical protein
MSLMPASVEAFFQTTIKPPVRGMLHRPAGDTRDCLVLTHGAGSDCNARLLVALAECFADAGLAVLRCDLPFRQKRPSGPPRGSAAEDQSGLLNAVDAVKAMFAGRVYLGGQSYGGRQASMLVAREPQLADGLLLLSYPLHAPATPQKLRTEHFPKLQVPVLFVHGTKDPFGSLEEIQSARKLIPATTELVPVEPAGHDLGYGRKKLLAPDLPLTIVTCFTQLFTH